MNSFHIAENIVRLRHEKKVTQEQLAQFIGVTKASVSKWETGQSMPDIVILPQLAAFFDISVDELIGYTPQLSKEQIQNLYQQFAKEFASGPFEEVFSRTRAYVKRYYSCFPFLFQICVLWLNHYTMAGSEERKGEILVLISDLCGHIKENCREVQVMDDAIVLQAMVLLRLGRIQDVKEALEELSKPDRLTAQSDAVLIQAYLAEGDMEKAEGLMQISMYSSLVSLVGTAANYVAVHMQDLDSCEPTINRIGRIEEAYGLSKLNPNLIAGFEYQAAICYALHGRKEQALEHADRFVFCVEELFSSDIVLLHGDDYFSKIEKWFEQSVGGAGAPRNREVVLEEVKQYFAHPAFAAFKEDVGFQRVKQKLSKIC